MKKIISLTMIVCLIFLSSCSSTPNVKSEVSEKLVVYTSFYPLYYLANQIGKDKIELKIIIPNGVEPHDYEPSMKKVQGVEKADIFIYNGANFEPWSDKLIENIGKGKITTVNASQAVELIKNDGVPDPHIWLNPLNMDKIGLEVKNALVLKDEKNKEFYENNYLELSKKLHELDQKYETVLKNKKKDIILVSHSAFSYMAKRYGLRQVAVAGITPDEEPSPKTMAKLVELAKEENIKYIFFETLASPKTADIIAKEANLKVLTLNPVAGLTKEEQKNGEDYISIMYKNLSNLKKVLVD